MARYRGYNGAVEVSATEVGELESFDIEQSVNQITANTLGNSSTDVDAGQMSWSGTINVFHDPDDAQHTALLPGATVALVLFPAGNTTGLESITGNFLVTTASTTVGADDNVKRSYSVMNKGDVTIGTVA
jgi:hypothetical protein